MYNIDLAPTFIRTVNVNVPEGRGVRAEKFDATFRALELPELEQFNMGTKDGQSGFLRAAIVSLDGIAGKDGPIAHSAELVERVIGRHWDRNALLGAYWEGVNGAAEGN